MSTEESSGDGRDTDPSQVDDEPTESDTSEDAIAEDECIVQVPAAHKEPIADEEEDTGIWEWWREKSRRKKKKKHDGQKWKTLEHNGPVFPPPYQPLPKNVKFYYNGKPVRLSMDAEEVAGFYAKMLKQELVLMDVFNRNFFEDWRNVMTSQERKLITDFWKCDFREMHAYFVHESNKRKAMSKEEKQKKKQKEEELMEMYRYCIVDGHKQRIKNFKIEPPRLFRGYGDNPKMGKLKKRVHPEDVIINIGKEARIPRPPKGHKWKEVRHDNTVSWLACWQDNISGQMKYVELDPSTKLKGEKDWLKYEKARELKQQVDWIRSQYESDWEADDSQVQQCAVALYFIDLLALRSGVKKKEGKSADTVGCCSLRVEHIKLHRQKYGRTFVVEFDFPGKGGIRYTNSIPVEETVFRKLEQFVEDKQEEDLLFDQINTNILNKYLNKLMKGLTAKVFRTYNASQMLQEKLDELTERMKFIQSGDMSVKEMLNVYKEANSKVATLCNHRRSVSRSASLRQLVQGVKNLRVQSEEVQDISLNTSKLNYLDPRITVAWCKKWNVPIEKIYNKTQREKFRWAIEMVGPDYTF